MKIAIDARVISTSTGRYVERLLEYLQDIDKKNEYYVLLLKKDINSWSPKSDNFKKIESNYPFYTFREQLNFAAFLYRLNVDLVHFTMPQHPILYFKPYIITIHDLTLINYKNRRRMNPIKDFYKHVVKPFAFRQLLVIGVNKARHIITPTDYVKQQVIEKLDSHSRKVTRTYESADKLASNPKPYKIKGRFILAVGNAYPYKNLKKLINVCQTDELKGYKLVLVGKTDYFYEQLHRYVEKKHISNVEFTDFAPDEQLAWLYQNASLYIFPSLSEGFGLPGLEAMAYGTPVAASKATCLPEVYGDAAVYFDPNSTEDMVRVISNTLESEAELRRLKEAGPKHLKRYSWKRMAEQTLRVYEKALKR